MEEILKKNWEYILYKDGDRYILSVVTGGAALVDVNFVLNEEEMSKYNARGEEYIEELAKQVAFRPAAFQDRHIKL